MICIPTMACPHPPKRASPAAASLASRKDAQNRARIHCKSCAARCLECRSQVNNAPLEHSIYIYMYIYIYTNTSSYIQCIICIHSNIVYLLIYDYVYQLSHKLTWYQIISSTVCVTHGNSRPALQSRSMPCHLHVSPAADHCIQRMGIQWDVHRQTIEIQSNLW